jgi:hypothetical protein
LREAERRERLSASGLLRPDEPALNLGDRLNTFDLDFGNFKFKKVAAHRKSLPLPKYRDSALRAYLPNTVLTGLSPVLSCETMVTSAFRQAHSRSWRQLFSTAGRSAGLSWFYDLGELNERIRL